MKYRNLKPAQGRPTDAHTLDGHRLHAALRRSAGLLANDRARLNRINVFPVADADTGSNLDATLRGLLAACEPGADAGTLLQAAADGALLSSRGNSGTILAQFLTGLARGAAGCPVLDSATVAAAAAEAAAAARQAVAEPAPGTMLSVMDAWADALGNSARGPSPCTPAEALEAALAAAVRALAETPRQLPALAAAGVVDAGAEGFVCLARGLAEAAADPATAEQAAGTLIAEPKAPGSEPQGHDAAACHGGQLPGPPALRYCTEILVEAVAADTAPAALRERLAPLGDSLIVAGAAPRLKVHLHTDSPERAAAELTAFGRLGPQKVEDMRQQYAAHHQPLADVAVVTDSCCDLPREVLDDLLIHQVPLSIHWDEDQFIDRRTLSAGHFYALMAERSTHPTTSQPPVQRFEQLYRGLAQHHRAVLSLHLPARLSGTANAARLAAERVPEVSVRVLDLGQVSAGLGLVVRATAEAVAAGAGAEDAIALARSLEQRTEILLAVPSLDALVRGGRIPAAAGRLTRLSGLQPVISLGGDGTRRRAGPRLRGLARRFDRAVDRLVHALQCTARTRRCARWAVVHSDNAAAADALAARVHAELGQPPAYTMETSPIIGAHAGPGAVAVAVQWHPRTG